MIPPFSIEVRGCFETTVGGAKPNIVVRIRPIIVQIQIPDTSIRRVVPIATRNQA